MSVVAAAHLDSLWNMLPTWSVSRRTKMMPATMKEEKSTAHTAWGQDKYTFARRRGSFSAGAAGGSVTSKIEFRRRSA